MHSFADTAFESTAYSVADVRGIDRAAIEDEGIPGYTLMTRAAETALAAARARFADRTAWVFLCGGGNNAGDGYVMARLAQAAGIAVTTYWLSDPEGLGGDAENAYRDFLGAGLTATAFDETTAVAGDLVVDAMLGNGLQRDVTGSYRSAVDWANEQAAPVVALDIPTGLNGDSGQVMGVAVRADLTVTFVGLKAGLLLSAGPGHCGEIQLADLEIPARCRASAVGVLRMLDNAGFRTALAPRARDTHKGLYGHVVVVGGAPGMSGAARIAGEAALRTGAGLVSVLTRPEHAATLNHGRPELMVSGVERAAEARPALARADVIAIGPGLGLEEWGRSLLALALDMQKPLVIDADGLTILAESGALPGDAVLTPHPGEAARLLGVGSAQVQADRLGALSDLAQKYAGSTVILKGAGSLVNSAQGLPWLCTAGNPGMASAGMGDALTGIVAALRAQGLPAELAAVVGTRVHAMAGDAAAESGERGLMASDLLQQIRAQVNP